MVVVLLEDLIPCACVDCEWHCRGHLDRREVDRQGRELEVGATEPFTRTDGEVVSLGAISQITDLDAIRCLRKVVDHVAAERVRHGSRDDTAGLKYSDLAASQRRSGRTVGDRTADVAARG